ncbi:MAG: hypothetical protein RLZZ15_2974 [Verrucomicrobiota bacterium]|jgi:predicted ATPase
MAALVREGSQFIIATHSPILMTDPRATILVIGEDGLAPERDEETRHFTIARRFLNDPTGMLEKMLRPGE